MNGYAKCCIYTHTMKDYSAIKKQWILIPAITFINFENNMQKEARHKRPYITWIHPYEISKIVKSIAQKGD